MKGDIVLVPFPNSDLSTWKRRPALVLYEDPTENETTVAYISTKTPIIPSTCDVLVTRGILSFDETGLKHNSVIKLKGAQNSISSS
jgi:mRNA-degrading endonuclease toxin of MazEF toxin-antitoxin module